MLADLRFMLGAVLAMTVLAVAGLGVATSVELMRAAHMGPLADSRSLAYAASTTRNEFYDPETARRVAGEKIEAPRPAPEPAPVVAMPEQIVSLPADPPQAAPEENEVPRAPATEALAPITPAPVEPTATPSPPSAAAVATPPDPQPADEPAPEQPVAPERVASAPAAPAPAESPEAARAPIAIPPLPKAAPSAESTSKPSGHPKPAFKRRIARHRLHRAFVTATTQNSMFGNQQFPSSSFPNSQFPTAGTTWQSYNNSFWNAPKRAR